MPTSVAHPVRWSQSWACWAGCPSPWVSVSWWRCPCREPDWPAWCSACPAGCSRRRCSSSCCWRGPKQQNKQLSSSIAEPEPPILRRLWSWSQIFGRSEPRTGADNFKVATELEPIFHRSEPRAGAGSGLEKKPGPIPIRNTASYFSRSVAELEPPGAKLFAPKSNVLVGSGVGSGTLLWNLLSIPCFCIIILIANDLCVAEPEVSF